MNVDYSTVKVRQTLVVPSDSSPCVNKTRSPETNYPFSFNRLIAAFAPAALRDSPSK